MRHSDKHTYVHMRSDVAITYDETSNFVRQYHTSVNDTSFSKDDGSHNDTINQMEILDNTFSQATDTDP